MLKDNVINQPLSAVGYLLKGLKLISHPRLRHFVLIPFLINLVIFAGAFWFIFSSVMNWIDGYITELLPDFLSWLSYLFWPILIGAILLTFSFLFSIVANLIAAPFNGLLSERTENLLTNSQLNNDSVLDSFKDLPRIFKRELQKLTYFLPRMLLCFILYFIPIIGQTIVPFIWFAFSGWMMAIQYADFPFDNHKVSFKEMKSVLKKHTSKNLTFGVLVSFFTTIPVVNFIIMPIAVCASTAIWVDLYKEEITGRK